MSSSNVLTFNGAPSVLCTATWGVKLGEDRRGGDCISNQDILVREESVGMWDISTCECGILARVNVGY